MKPRACYHCVHCQGFSLQRAAMCSRPAEGQPDIVTGEPKTRNRPCTDERSPRSRIARLLGWKNDRCGPEGRFWKVRPLAEPPNMASGGR